VTHLSAVHRIVASSVAAVALLLVAASAPASAEAERLGARTLDRGDRGADVRALQRLLVRAGFRTATDGVYGTGTERTVRVFERALELPVDGRVAPRDVRELRAAVSGSDGTGGYAAREPRAPQEAAPAQGGDARPGRGRGGAEPETTPGPKAVLTEDGLAIAPEGAPQQVKDVIAAANAIARKPYRYGGGHGRWEDTGYDCSGSVSYALHGGGLLERSMPSGGFTSWGEAGEGEWITIYANGGHMYAVIAGLRFDTSGRSRSGSRWQREMRDGSGYTVRHPAGL
jgi:peptidoglycan hydrolase-like protein with peptidoglycan-binding domain